MTILDLRSNSFRASSEIGPIDRRPGGGIPSSCRPWQPIECRGPFQELLLTTESGDTARTALSAGRAHRGTGSSNPTLGSFGRSKNARDSAILGDQINEFCPRFCPRRKAIKDPGWCGLDAPGQQFIHRPRTWRYPRLHPACSQAARQGRARAPQSTMTKVGKSHSKGTFAGAFGNDEDAPKPDLATRMRAPPVLTPPPLFPTPPDALALPQDLIQSYLLYR